MQSASGDVLTRVLGLVWGDCVFGNFTYRVAVLQTDGWVEPFVPWHGVQALSYLMFGYLRKHFPAYPSDGSTVDRTVCVCEAQTALCRQVKQKCWLKYLLLCDFTHVTYQTDWTGVESGSARWETCWSLKKGGHLSCMKTQSVPRSKHTVSRL